MMKKEGSIQITNFMTPGQGFLQNECGHASHIVKMHFFCFKIHSQAYIRQIMYIVMTSKENSNKIVDFITPEAKLPVLGCDHISHIVKMHYFFKNLLLYCQT